MNQPCGLKLSIVVIFHNMRREAQRTLYSLSCTYQKGVSHDDYEVIAIDNGSKHPLTADSVSTNGPNFRYAFHDTESISPVEAANAGVKMSSTDNIAVIIDGARMATPGLVATSLRALNLFSDPFVAGLSWHLGPDVQNKSMLDGYNQEIEDALLSTVDWRTNGYRLFEISTLAQSSSAGFLGGLPPECSWLCLRRATFDQLGGYDSRFRSGGGGLVNHDFLNRAIAHPGLEPVVLLGEGVFHQFHGGVATNVALQKHPINDFKQEYLVIRGRPYEALTPASVSYFGTMPSAARAFVNPPNA